MTVCIRKNGYGMGKSKIYVLKKNIDVKYTSNS